VDEIYFSQDFREIADGIQVMQREKWRIFNPSSEKKFLRFSWRIRFHRGYAHRIKCTEYLKSTWPNISGDILEYLFDCGCALIKKT
jgi:hypothetical protein